jgi:hypothetical protein
VCQQDGGFAKEGDPCKVCGKPCPPGRHRAYCSPECTKRRPRDRKHERQHPRPATADCLVCGKVIDQATSGRGKTVRLCSPECRRQRQNARQRSRPGRKPASIPCGCCGKPVPQDVHGTGPPKTTCSDECRFKLLATPRNCARCGVEFLFVGKKMFCSDGCRWGRRLSDPVPCGRCGKPFVRKKHGITLCSPECREAAKIERDAKMGARSAARRKKYVCLHCGVTFGRKKCGPRSYSSTAGKYCTRECAFAADAVDAEWNSMRNWFLGWGDDVYPITKSCPTCDGTYKVRGSGPEQPAACWECSRYGPKNVGKCEDCKQLFAREKRCHKRCRDCLSRKRKLANREARRRDRRLGRRGSENYRQRCRKYGVHYESFSRRSIFERDNWTCQICHCQLSRKYGCIPGTEVIDPRSPTIDHKIALSAPDSPGHRPSNVHAACWECNTEKGTEPLESFARRKRAAVHS